MTLLDPENVDLGDLALALEDHSQDHRWWFDPARGVVEPRFEEAPGDGFVAVEALPSAVGYRDMKDFVAIVRDPRARHLLTRAIVGRGAFRRFKDALLEYPELRQAWFAFHDARGERRAIEWLVEHSYVTRVEGESALERRPEPGPDDMPGLVDAHGIAQRVASDLGRLYGARLGGVVLTGAWVRSDAQPDAAIELLVVLDRVPVPWQEKRRMDRIVWRHSIRHDTVVTVLPVTEADLDSGATPLLALAAAEGIRVS